MLENVLLQVLMKSQDVKADATPWRMPPPSTTMVPTVSTANAYSVLEADDSAEPETEEMED